LLLLLGIKTIKTSITCFRRSMPCAWEDVARDTMLKRLELNLPTAVYQDRQFAAGKQLKHAVQSG